MRRAFLLLALFGCARTRSPAAPASTDSTALSTPAPPITGTFKLAAATSREMHCSLSFERDSLIRSYDLTIADDGQVSLDVRELHRHVMGSGATTSRGHETRTKSKSRYLGRAIGRPNGVELELRGERTAKAWTLRCLREDITIDDAQAPSRHAVVPGIRCDGIGPLSEAPGLWSEEGDDARTGRRRHTLRRGF